MPCDKAPAVDPNGHYNPVLNDTGAILAWMLSCNKSFAAPPLLGNMAMCATNGSFLEPRPGLCQTDPGCDGLEAVLELYKAGQPVTQHDCKMSMNDGDSCRVQCQAGYSSVGFFACVAQGKILGEARCMLPGQATNYSAMVAGMLRCQLDVTDETVDALSGIFKTALATALQLPVQAVLRVSVALLNTSRRLHIRALRPARRMTTRSINTYSVTYELGANHSAGAAELAKRMTQLATGGSQELQLLTKSLLDNHNIGVKKVDVLMAPRVFEGGVAPSPAPAAKAKPAKEDVDMAQIGITAVIIVGGLMVLFFCYSAVQRMRWLYKQHNES